MLGICGYRFTGLESSDEVRWQELRVKKQRSGIREFRVEFGSLSRPYTLHPTPYALHPTPYTLHPTPYTLHPTPYTLNPEP